LIRICSQF